MRTSVLAVGMLLVAGLVVAVPPAAAADACDAIMQDPPQACHAAVGIVAIAAGYALCYYNTPPSQWANCV